MSADVDLAVFLRSASRSFESDELSDDIPGAGDQVPPLRAAPQAGKRAAQTRPSLVSYDSPTPTPLRIVGPLGRLMQRRKFVRRRAPRVRSEQTGSGVRRHGWSGQS